MGDDLTIDIPDLGHQRAALRKALRLVSHHIRTLADQRREIDRTERVITEIINEALKETENLPSDYPAESEK